MSVHIVISAVMLKRMRWYGGGVEPEPVTYPIRPQDVLSGVGLTFGDHHD